MSKTRPGVKPAKIAPMLPTTPTTVTNTPTPIKSSGMLENEFPLSERLKKYCA